MLLRSVSAEIGHSQIQNGLLSAIAWEAISPPTESGMGRQPYCRDLEVGTLPLRLEHLQTAWSAIRYWGPPSSPNRAACPSHVNNRNLVVYLPRMFRDLPTRK